MIKHTTASACHYDKEADSYDTFNEQNTVQINVFLENLFVKHNIRTIADFTCGTGAQLFYLTEKGFIVTGSDINEKMIAIAKKKAGEKKIEVSLYLGDMRTIYLGTFDAAITIFNAIGHLTVSDFEHTLQNMHQQLHLGGLYVFDIFNLDYLLKDDNITRLTIDWLKKVDNKIIREIQYSTITSEGVLASYDLYFEQITGQEISVTQAVQTLQVYSAKQLQDICQKNGFKVIVQCDTNGNPFDACTSQRIITVAQKI